MAITALSNSGLAGDKYYNAMTVNNYMEPIATQLLGSSTATVTFDNIPRGYTHLQVRGIARSTQANTGLDNLWMRINSDSGTNYARHHVMGDGATASAAAATSIAQAVVGDIARNNNTANIFGAFVIDILDYTNQNKYKTIRAISGGDLNGSGEIRLRSSLWMNTSPITSLTFLSENESLVQYSRFSLYGLRG